MPLGSNAVRLLTFKSLFGSSRITGAPATIYFALLRHASTPGTTLGTEPTSAGDYARVAVSNVDAQWTFSANGGENTNEIRWPVASAVYSITDPLNQWAIYDNNSGGNLIAFGALSTTITVTGAGDQPVIPAGSLDLSMNA